MWKGLPFATTCLLVTLAVPVRASDPDVSHLLQQQLSEQRSRERQFNRERFSPGLPVAPVNTVPSAPTANCFALERVVIAGASLLSETERNSLQRFADMNCVDAGQISDLVNSINQRYQAAGYITSRAAVPPQDLSSGELLIEVTEGRIEAIVSAEQALSAAAMAAVFPSEAGGLLHLRDLEQALDNLHRLRSFVATLELLPGQSPGFSRVNLETRQRSRWHYQLSFNNHGQAATGEHQAGAFLAADNLFGRAGYLYAYLQSDTSSAGGAARSRSWQLHYDRPFGYWRADADISVFSYSSALAGVASRILNSGEVKQYKLAISRVLHRDATVVTRASMEWRRRENRSFIGTVELQTATRDLEVAGFSLSQQRYLANAQILLRTGFDRGVDWSGADYGDAHAGGPQSRFRKYWLALQAAGHYQAAGGIALQWQQQLQAQRSSKRLYNSEQLSIGGHYSVRGLSGNSFSGSSGGYWRQSVSLLPVRRSAAWWLPHKITLGVDVGRVDDDIYGWQNLRGSGVEMQHRLQNLVVSMSYNRALGVPSQFNDSGETLLFSLQLSGS